MPTRDDVDAELDSLESAVGLLRKDPSRLTCAGDLADAAGMASASLADAVRTHYHTTPAELIARARVDEVCAQLVSAAPGPGDIAAKADFETTAEIIADFARLTGMTPPEYRDLKRAAGFKVKLPGGFQQAAVLGYFGRDPQSVCERVTGNELRISAAFASGAGQVDLVFGPESVRCQVTGGTALEAHRGVVRMLGLRQDPTSFEQLAAKLGYPELYRGRCGLRMPQTFSAYDAVVWSIVGQQVNLAFAYSLRRRLVEQWGVPVSDGLISPPTPEVVANLIPEDLLPLQFSRRKAEYLIGISKQIASGEISLSALENGSATRAERILLALRGLGPWSVHYLLMRGLGFADCVPLGDTGLTSALQKIFNLDRRPDTARTRELMAPFSPHRSLACLHLWQSLKNLE